jgi:hypothetical protein
MKKVLLAIVLVLGVTGFAMAQGPSSEGAQPHHPHHHFHHHHRPHHR